MLDIKYIRENPEAVKDSVVRRGLSVDIDRLLELDAFRRNTLEKVQQIQSKRNALASEVKSGRPSERQVALGKELKNQHDELDKELNSILDEYRHLLSDVPNLISGGTPDGGEENNLEIYKWGEIQKNFEPKDHLEISKMYDLYDFESGSKVAGNKFYFTKHRALKLWQAVLIATQEIVESNGFELIGVPHLVSEDVAKGSGYLPRGEESQNYVDSSQGLVMIATSEIPLTGMHRDEVIKLDEPIKYAGISPCYRLEAGAYGKFSKGLYRTHQFEKLEMYVFCMAEHSSKMLQEILNIEKSICEAMEIPYRVTRTAAGDMSAPAFEKYDVEYYSPVDKMYRELTSCSNCTDYQARNLNIKYKSHDGKLNYVHTLNGTAVVSSRMPIAILENHQNENGEVILPDILAKYYGSDKL